MLGNLPPSIELGIGITHRSSTCDNALLVLFVRGRYRVDAGVILPNHLQIASDSWGKT
jgi:hypothetical protein